MFDTLIPQMNYVFVRDSFCELLAAERDNQIKIAHLSGFSDNFIKENIDFTVYPKKYRMPDIEDMPCVFVYIENEDFPEDLQSYGGAGEAIAKIAVEYYAAGTSTNETPADTNADNRFNYLSSQIHYILNSEDNADKGTEGFIKHCVFKGWHRVQTPDDMNEAITVLGGKFNYEIGINEPANLAKTIKIRDLYIKAHIRDEFIDPYVRILRRADVSECERNPEETKS